MILGDYVGDYKQIKSFTFGEIFDDIVEAYVYGTSVNFVSKNTKLVLGVSHICTIEGKYRIFEKV